VEFEGFALASANPLRIAQLLPQRGSAARRGRATLASSIKSPPQAPQHCQIQCHTGRLRSPALSRRSAMRRRSWRFKFGPDASLTAPQSHPL
jgi:hypothetical protein